jgi:hypothetical protein
LGNDEILVGLSEASKKAGPPPPIIKPKAPVQKPKVMPPKVQAKTVKPAARNRPLKSTEEYVPMPISSTSSSSASTKAAYQSSLVRKPLGNGASSNSGHSNPSQFNTGHSNSTATSRLNEISRQLAKPSTSNLSANDKMRNASKSPQATFDAEKELREIEILERKTKLLKEYKQLAQEIADIESKRVGSFKKSTKPFKLKLLSWILKSLWTLIKNQISRKTTLIQSS